MEKVNMKFLTAKKYENKDLLFYGTVENVSHCIINKGMASTSRY